MTTNGWLQIAIFFLLVLLATKPLGLYMARVFEGRRTLLDPLLVPVERLLYRMTRVDLEEEMAGTVPVTTPLFTALLTSVILIVGALTFVPALSLGPVLEHLMMHAGQVF